MKAIASASLLALLAGAGGAEPAEYRTVRIDMTVVVPPPPHRPFERYRSPPNSDCAPDREGEYRTSGNRWLRHGGICLDRIEVSFEAFPDPTLGYAIQSDRCPRFRHFSRFETPDGFFERRVPGQIAMLKRALADDLREFGRRCGISLDPEPFVDGRFDRFYADYGDGWWFDRVGDSFRLTADMTSGGAEPAADRGADIGDPGSGRRPDDERWIAGSRTAISITGDILLSPTRLRAAGADFPLRVAADLERFGDFEGVVAARILEVTRPTSPRMRGGNSFGCGDRPIRWIAVWRFDNGRQLAMATFGDNGMPTSVRDGALCAAYYYLRPDYHRSLSAR